MKIDLTLLIIWPCSVHDFPTKWQYLKNTSAIQCNYSTCLRMNSHTRLWGTHGLYVKWPPHLLWSIFSLKMHLIVIFRCQTGKTVIYYLVVKKWLWTHRTKVFMCTKHCTFMLGMKVGIMGGGGIYHKYGLNVPILFL